MRKIQNVLYVTVALSDSVYTWCTLIRPQKMNTCRWPASWGRLRNHIVANAPSIQPFISTNMMSNITTYWYLLKLYVQKNIFGNIIHPCENWNFFLTSGSEHRKETLSIYPSLLMWHTNVDMHHMRELIPSLSTQTRLYYYAFTFLAHCSRLHKCNALEKRRGNCQFHANSAITNDTWWMTAALLGVCLSTLSTEFRKRHIR